MNCDKKPVGKIIALVLCGALLFGSAGAAVYALGTGEKEEGSSSEEIKAESGTSAKSSSAKDETVYVIAGADGSAKKIIVSDWIKNSADAQKITDKSDLSNLETIKDNMTYTINDGNMKVWDAEGKDVYYEGTMDKTLPVEMSIRYELDGKSISAEDLAGKSGKVTIHFDYNNRQYEMVKIDGKDEKIYVPFAMLTGMILKNDNFKNIEVSNGKLINDGDRTIVAGIAFPGLAENLNLDQSKLEIPNSVEITAEVTDFELETTMTVATNEIFNEVNTDKISDVDDLAASMDEMTAAMNQLMDGSSALYDGIATLLDKSDELISGIDQLAAGAKQLSAGAGELSGGAASLQKGTDALSAGLGNLVANNQSLNAGAKQIFESLLSTANTQLEAAGLKTEKLTPENYAKVLNGILASMDEASVRQTATTAARSKVEAAVRAKEPEIRAEVTKQIRDKVLEQILKTQGMEMTAAQYQDAVNAGKITKEVQSAISAAVETQMASADIQKKINEETEAQIQKIINDKMNSDEVKTQINAAVESAKNGSSSIAALKTQLDSVAQFYQGVLTYTAGVDKVNTGMKQVKSGTDTLKTGTDSLKKGADDLADGLASLQSGSGALKNGVSQLKDGAMQLSDGLKEFNEKGVKKLTDAVNGDLR